MGKSLIDKLRNVGRGIRDFILLGTAVASIGIASCKIPQPDPVQNDPTVTLSISPNSGEAPLPSQIKVDGSNTTVLSVYIDYNNNQREDSGEGISSSKSSSINTSYTFEKAGNFNVYAEATGLEGQLVQASSPIRISQAPIDPPPVIDYLDVSGQVINDKTRVGQKAKVKVENSANETSPIDIIDTDNNGNFVYHSKTKVSDLSGVTLKAVLTDLSGNPISYANTMRYPAGDVTGAVLEPYPHPDFASASDYKQHYLISNVYSGISSGNKRWDFKGKIAPENELKEIDILTTNPILLNSLAFTTGPGNQDDIVTTKIKDANDIEVAIRGSDLSDTDLNGFPDLDKFVSENPSTAHYTIFGDRIFANPGYIIVVPDSTLPSSEWGDTSVGYYQSIATGIINSAVIRINPNLTKTNFERVVSHEFKHALTNPFDLIPPYTSQTLSPSQTIIRYDTPNTTLGDGPADIEDAYVANGNPPAEKANNFLGDW